ncbi:MAG TPA: DUF1398 domain-containing protein [Gemmataceae bacterium]
MDVRVLYECNRLAFENGITFPETVRRLAATGVERYTADLVQLQKTYYSAAGEVRTDLLPLGDRPAIAGRFDAPAVEEALAAIRQGRIDYPEFLRRVMRAGVASYSVHLAGRKAVYLGRGGDLHVEPFPGPG